MPLEERPGVLHARSPLDPVSEEIAGQRDRPDEDREGDAIRQVVDARDGGGDRACRDEPGDRSLPCLSRTEPWHQLPRADRRPDQIRRDVARPRREDDDEHERHEEALWLAYHVGEDTQPPKGGESENHDDELKERGGARPAKSNEAPEGAHAGAPP